jgi:hypothetical protein
MKHKDARVSRRKNLSLSTQSGGELHRGADTSRFDALRPRFHAMLVVDILQIATEA